MSLLLSPRAIGTGWRAVPIGDVATPLTQWLHMYEDHKAWEPIPDAVIGLPCRAGNMWREPIDKRAKKGAIKMVKGNLFVKAKLYWRYILFDTASQVN